MSVKRIEIELYVSHGNNDRIIKCILLSFWVSFKPEMRKMKETWRGFNTAGKSGFEPGGKLEQSGTSPTNIHTKYQTL